MGGDFVALELWSFRLYLGASFCIFIYLFFFLFMIFLFLFEMSMIGGDTLIICFWFHIVY